MKGEVANGLVWGGTDENGDQNYLYRASSKISRAAVHAGLLNQGQQGVLKVTLTPPQTLYRASDFNGQESEIWDVTIDGADGPYSYLIELSHLLNQ